VDQSQIQLGTEYAYRDKPLVRGSLEHVRVLDRVRGKWRIEWIEPNAGLQEFVSSKNIVVPWKNHKRFLAEERAWQLLREESSSTWPGHQDPVDDAVILVLEATGENIWCARYGVLSGEISALNRVASRAGIEIEIVAPSFKDSEGAVHLPFAKALKIAQSFAVAEPATVLAQVSAEESDIQRLEREYDSTEMTRLHIRSLAGWALVREWAGFDVAMSDQHKEVERLRRIIQDFELTLRRAGHEDLAKKLERLAR
jgi:hypothetical protein